MVAHKRDIKVLINLIFSIFMKIYHTIVYIILHMVISKVTIDFNFVREIRKKYFSEKSPQIPDREIFAEKVSLSFSSSTK